ncbi:o-succinylbenzoate synthase [Myceligenerans xiligouense]|uniref:o-succinylbenzoate synthase n=1 Tax=Myceligenerans xiligouense TaxID=253184 RepID=A0A3N4ZPS7_9MICO|nr:o-succinylbenzoate synthase [Myceligenerans xiligouense]RPF22975.1 O-succinylbenzoate synthase [Myceligenerans xiligouense]
MHDTIVWSTPLRTRFRGLDTRDGMLIRGDAGWGELSPFWDYDDAESATWLRAAREAADTGWPAPVRDTVPVNVTVPAVEPEQARAIVLASGGCRTAKIKVAQRLPGGDVEPLSTEQARVEAVRSAFDELLADDDGPGSPSEPPADRTGEPASATARRPGARIRIDANGGWSLDEALRRLPVLDRAAGGDGRSGSTHGLEYVEQPCASVEDLAAVRRAQHVPVAADESIRRAEDPLRVVRLEAADVVVLKVAPLGGVRACLDLAEQVGLPVVVSSALESSVGLAAGVALAAALPDLPHACGLATAQLLVHDVVAAPLLPVDGAIPVRRPSPDPAALARATAPRDVADRWRARYHRLAQVLDTADAVGSAAG